MAQASSIIYDSGPGPMRTILEAHGAALRLFDQRTQNDITREAMRRVGEFWIAVFLPQRFDRSKRAVPPGYGASKAWEQSKVDLAKRGVIDGPQPTPLVYLGVMRANVMAKARAEARATRNRAYVIIRLPIGHAIRPKIKQILRWLPDYEIKRISEVLEKQMVLLLQSDAERDKIERQAPPTPRTKPQGPPRERDSHGQFRKRVV